VLPSPASQPWDYLVTATVAAAVYSLINQLLVSRVVSMVDGSSFLVGLKDACANELLPMWPVVVSYGLLVGVASESAPVVLLLAGIPVALLVIASRTNQQRRDEYERMRGLYNAAQDLHEARTDEDMILALSQSIQRTLGVDDTTLRSQPPRGEELGAWLPNRGAWVVLPSPASSETRRQDSAFLQALASLVDAGMERAALVGELERQSLRDPLTNAFNRRFFHQALSDVFEAPDQQPGCLALLDIDHFKAINDTFGHEVGDITLKELVDAVTETFRNNDVLCRLGGDEFALILPGLTPPLAVERLDLLRRRLAGLRPGEPSRGPVGFRLSVGVAAYPQHGREPSELLRSADQALYHAKREGRDRVMVSATSSGSFRAG
jgi:diguanylate cyclase (GGDEF)-like protein